MLRSLCASTAAVSVEGEVASDIYLSLGTAGPVQQLEVILNPEPAA